MDRRAGLLDLPRMKGWQSRWGRLWDVLSRAVLLARWWQGFRLPGRQALCYRVFMQGFQPHKYTYSLFFLYLTIWYLDIRQCYKLPLFMRLWYIQEYMWFVVYDSWSSVKDFSVISWGWCYEWAQKAVLIKNCQTESRRAPYLKN